MICKLGTVLNVALRGQAKLRKNHTNPIVVAKALLGSDAVAVGESRKRACQLSCYAASRKSHELVDTTLFGDLMGFGVAGTSTFYHGDLRRAPCWDTDVC